MVSAPQKRQQFRIRKLVGVWNGPVQFCFIQPRQFMQHLLMNSIQDRPNFAWRGVLGRVSLRHRLRPEEANEVLRDKGFVLRLLSPNAPQGQPVLGKCQMTDLPADMTDAARSYPKPVGGGRLIEQPDGVVTSEDDLFDGELTTWSRPSRQGR